MNTYPQNLFLTDEELKRYGKINNLSEKAEALLLQQKEIWSLVNDNYSALNKVKTRNYDFGNHYIKTQFNPSRIVSTTAKVDRESIANRACFLCGKNLPEVQKGINYKNKYALLINPYPIFKQHLTIPYHDHIPQSIETTFNDLLELSYELKDNFFVFYNGPKCGASAPDHLHFQAGLKYSTPLEKYYSDLIHEGTIIHGDKDLKVVDVKTPTLNFIYIKSVKSELIQVTFNKILAGLKLFQNTNEEPLLNIISFVENGTYQLFIIPRKKHRPAQFFSEGEAKLLISPASVDMAGLLITPREEDFTKLKLNDIENIYQQVTFGDGIKEILREVF